MILLKLLFWIVLATAIYVYEIGHVGVALGIGSIAFCVLAADMWVAMKRPAAQSGLAELLERPESRVIKLSLYFAFGICALVFAPSLVEILHGHH